MTTRVRHYRPGSKPERITREELEKLSPAKPVFGDVSRARRSKRVQGVTLSKHLHAILKREQPAIAELAELERRFHPVRKWRFDLAWTEQRVAVECDGGIYSGGAHVRGMGVEDDAEKQSEACALGWRVLRVTRKMIDDGRAVSVIVRALRWSQEGDQ
jgi:very-short-patch-repair endonuclease